MRDLIQKMNEASIFKAPNSEDPRAQSLEQDIKSYVDKGVSAYRTADTFGGDKGTMHEEIIPLIKVAKELESRTQEARQKYGVVSKFKVRPETDEEFATIVWYVSRNGKSKLNSVEYTIIPPDSIGMNKGKWELSSDESSVYPKGLEGVVNTILQWIERGEEA